MHRQKPQPGLAIIMFIIMDNFSLRKASVNDDPVPAHEPLKLSAAGLEEPRKVVRTVLPKESGTSSGQKDNSKHAQRSTDAGSGGKVK